MPGIDGLVIKHCLNVDPMKKPRPTEETSIRPRAKQSSYGRGRKALDYRIYLRGLYPKWLANVFMVKSPTESGECVWTS